MRRRNGRSGIGTRRSRRARGTLELPGAVLALAAATLLAGQPAGAAAQGIGGVALGPDGEPLVGVPVLLHRVDAGGGAMAGTDTTGPDGAFDFRLESADSALYFAALRYEGQLYVGPGTPAGSEPVTDYVLQVSPSTEVGAVGAAMTGPPGAGMGAPAPARPAQSTRSGGSSDAGAIWLVALLALAAAAAFIYTAPRYRRRRTRDALIELAGIENRLAAPASTLSEGEREQLEERHARLKEQLAPRA